MHPFLLMTLSSKLNQSIIVIIQPNPNFTLLYNYSNLNLYPTPPFISQFYFPKQQHEHPNKHPQQLSILITILLIQ